MLRSCSGVPWTPTSFFPLELSSFSPKVFAFSHALLDRTVAAAPVLIRIFVGIPLTRPSKRLSVSSVTEKVGILVEPLIHPLLPGSRQRKSFVSLSLILLSATL